VRAATPLLRAIINSERASFHAVYNAALLSFARKTRAVPAAGARNQRHANELRVVANIIVRYSENLHG